MREFRRDKAPKVLSDRLKKNTRVISLISISTVNVARNLPFMRRHFFSVRSSWFIDDLLHFAIIINLSQPLGEEKHPIKQEMTNNNDNIIIIIIK